MTRAGRLDQSGDRDGFAERFRAASGKAGLRPVRRSRRPRGRGRGRARRSRWSANRPTEAGHTKNARRNPGGRRMKWLRRNGGGASKKNGSDDPGFFQSRESPVFIDGFERPAGELDADPAILLGNPNSLGLQVRGHFALHGFRDVTADAALFLGETGTTDSTADSDSATSDTANTCHNKIGVR